MRFLDVSRTAPQIAFFALSSIIFDFLLSGGPATYAIKDLALEADRAGP